jgi:polar amino acid transport system permease protein
VFGNPSTNAYLSLIANGFLVTIVISVIALSLASVLGLALGAIRAARLPIVSQLVGAYVRIFRSIPVVIQLFLVFYGVPVFLGITLDPIPSAVITLTLYEGAYMTEIARAGIEALPRGQTDAARALGMRYRSTMRHVVMPQALRVITPPWVGLLVGGIKDSSLASIIGVMDVTGAALTVRADTFSNWDIFAILTGLYFCVCTIVSYAGARLERLLARSDRPAGAIMASSAGRSSSGSGSATTP